MYEVFTQTDNVEYQSALRRAQSLESEAEVKEAALDSLKQQVSSSKEQKNQAEQKLKEQDEFYAEKLTNLQKDFNEVR